MGRLTGPSAIPLLVGAFATAACVDRPTVPSPPPPPDPGAPTISCPAPVSVVSPLGAPISVVYDTPMVGGGAPPVTAACMPASQSTFVMGSTTVTCTASDARQRTASCSFSVTVTAPPRISVTRFVAFGDSMTVGEDGLSTSGQFRTLLVVGNPYPTLLGAQLAQRYTMQSFVVDNQGLRGESLAQVSSSLPPAPPRFTRVVSGGRYDVALILEGVNDLQNRDSREIPAAISALATMVRTAKARGVRVILSTLPPQRPSSPRGLAWSLVPPFNAALKSMAASESVPVADVYQAFGGDSPNLSLISGDGLHPTQAGYQVIANTFFTTIKQGFEQPATTTTASPFRDIRFGGPQR